MKAKYFLLNGHLNVIRVIDVDYAYLNHKSGKWVRDNDLIGPVTGMDGDASTQEISKQDAQKWVRENHPNLNVEWL